MPSRRQFFAATALVGVAPFVSGMPPEAPARTPTGSFWEPLDRQMIDWLGIKPGQAVLDAGCGNGDHLGLFAESAGFVTGLDLSAKNLNTAKERLKNHRRRERIAYVKGDVLNPPFKSESFDLVWASHVLHILKDPVAGAKALASTLRQGGRLAVREDGAHTWMLPLDTGVGRPGLESRLNALFVEWFVDDRLARGRVPFGWTEVLRKAGLKDVRTKSFLFEAYPLFTEAQVTYLRSRLKRQLEWGDKLSAEDRRTLELLTDPKSEHDAFRRNDLHVVSVSTVYIGQV